MLGLTSPGLLALTIAAALLSLVAVAVLVTRPDASATAPLARRLALRTGPIVVLALAGQGFAVAAVGLVINNSYGFYTDWSDLVGRPTADAAITTGGLVAAGQGTARAFDVHAPVGGRNERVLVWTPPQYAAATATGRRLPVVMFLPGQPSTPAGTFRHFAFASTATRLIDTGRVPPFVAVFPTLMISPPRDNECTNVPGGPHAETWLEKDVPAFVTQHFAVDGPGPGWTAIGWSTGGFCATKLLTTHPADYSSAVSFGGYYRPIEDHTTGDLFHGDERLEHLNSPTWLFRHDQRDGGIGSDRILSGDHQVAPNHLVGAAQRVLLRLQTANAIHYAIVRRME